MTLQESTKTSEFTKFPKIGKLEDTERLMSKHCISSLPFVVLPKIHGTNAAIRLNADGTYQAQSRNRDITADSDNKGFAAFCDLLSNRVVFQAIVKGLNEDVILYGEWVGPGIQKTVALNELSQKYFIIFGALTKDSYELPYSTCNIPTHGRIRSISEFGYGPICFDLIPGPDSKESIEALGTLRDEYEATCPVAWGLEGIAGIGEGIVCVHGQVIKVDPTPTQEFGAFWFKVKGDKHSRSAKRSDLKTKRFHIVIAPVFVEFFTEDRLCQGLEYLDEMNFPRNDRSIRIYLEWAMSELRDEGPGDLNAFPKKERSTLSSFLVNWYKAHR